MPRKPRVPQRRAKGAPIGSRLQLHSGALRQVPRMQMMEWQPARPLPRAGRPWAALLAALRQQKLRAATGNPPAGVAGPRAQQRTCTACRLQGQQQRRRGMTVM